ncbi:hypothetical protein [[Eubacterium] cellulosolvens]
MTSWHTQQEKRNIKKYGGTPLRKYRTDGTIRGKPCEVRSVRKDHRYRLQKNVHQNLVRNNGRYIFVNKGKSKAVSARQVSKKLGRDHWFKDRSYPHKFLKVKQLF